jgi:hypothetical protein
MTDPTPPPQPVTGPGIMPSASTSASALGGAIAAMIIFILGAKGITFPAGAEAALAVIVTTLAGYIPKSGRQ